VLLVASTDEEEDAIAARKKKERKRKRILEEAMKVVVWIVSVLFCSVSNEDRREEGLALRKSPKDLTDPSIKYENYPTRFRLGIWVCRRKDGH
jgi:hypothetical protein